MKSMFSASMLMFFIIISQLNCGVTPSDAYEPVPETKDTSLTEFPIGFRLTFGDIANSLSNLKDIEFEFAISYEDAQDEILQRQSFNLLLGEDGNAAEDQLFELSNLPIGRVKVSVIMSQKKIILASGSAITLIQPGANPAVTISLEKVGSGQGISLIVKFKASIQNQGNQFDFQNDILPLLKRNKCTSCHLPDPDFPDDFPPSGDIDLTVYPFVTVDDFATSDQVLDWMIKAMTKARLAKDGKEIPADIDAFSLMPPKQGSQIRAVPQADLDTFIAWQSSMNGQTPVEIKKVRMKYLGKEKDIELGLSDGFYTQTLDLEDVTLGQEISLVIELIGRDDAKLAEINKQLKIDSASLTITEELLLKPAGIQVTVNE